MGRTCNTVCLRGCPSFSKISSLTWFASGGDGAVSWLSVTTPDDAALAAAGAELTIYVSCLSFVSITGPKPLDMMYKLQVQENQNSI